MATNKRLNQQWQVGKQRLLGAASSASAEHAIVAFEEPSGTPWEIGVVAFTDPDRDTIWVLREASLYVLTQNGAVGLDVGLGNVSWKDALVQRGAEGANEAKAAIDTQLDSASLIMPGERTTPLAPVLSQWFFVEGDFSSVGVEPQVLNAELDGDLVKIHLRSASGPTAVVWLDPDTRTLARAEENGKIVFTGNAG